MSDTDTNNQLPPAPGSYGYKQPAPPSNAGFGMPKAPPEPDDVPEIPYGYRRMEPSGIGPFNPYIPTGQNPATRDRPMSEVGRDDWVMRSMNDGVTDGVHVPQERDLPPLFHGVTMGFGQWAPPSIAMPAIAGGRFYGTAMQLYAKNQVKQANMARQNAEASYKITALRTKEYIGRIGNIYAAYGPTEKDPTSTARWHQELYALAGEYGDHKLQAMLERGEYDNVDRLVKHLDTNLSDLNKGLKKLQQQREQQLIDKEKARVKATQDAEAPFRKNPSAPAGKPPGSAPGTITDPATGQAIPLPDAPAATPDDPNLEWTDRPVTKPETSGDEPAHAPAAPGVDTPASEDGTPSETPSEDETPSSKSDTEVGNAGTPADQGGKPVQLAQADTGTMSDAAPPGAETLAKQAKALAAPVMAADDEAEAKPQLQGKTREQPPVAQAKPAEYTSPPSRALAGADADNWDPAQVDQLAQKMVNGTIKIQDLRSYPPEFQRWAQSRRLEVERELDQLGKSNLEGEDVLKALDKIDPEYGGVLRRYISGDFAIPASAWHNPSYLNRTLALGYKADHTFNGSTFAVRAATKKSYASGNDAKNITSIATLDRHARRMEDDLNALKKYDPNLLSSYIGAQRLGNLPFIRWFAGQPPEAQRLMTKLGVDAETVSNEYQRAVTGGKPTVSGVHTDMDNLDWRKIGIDNAIESARQRQAFAHERMKVLVDRYKAVVGRNEDALGRLYSGWAQNPDSRAGGLSPGSEIPDPIMDDKTLGDAIHMFKPQPPAADGGGGWKIEPIQ